MTMAHRFIVINGEIINGAVEAHRDLIKGSNKPEQCVGGGHVHFDHATQTAIFFGGSVEFGAISEKTFREAFEDSWLKERLDGWYIVFSEKETLADAILEFETRNS